MKFFIYCYFFVFLVFPIMILFSTSLSNLFTAFWSQAFSSVALCTYYLSFSLAFFACLINAFFGLIVAWVLVRYNFFGKKIFDAIVDLPFALPTSVTGLSLSIIYSSNGWFGKIGIPIVFTRFGILLAMVFVSLPFVIRCVQPTLLKINRQFEEAAWCLGANSYETFLKILWPTLIPALVTGMILSFSRSIGEYGAIVLLSSNFAFKDLVTSVLIVQCLEQYDYISSTVYGSILIFLCFFLFLVGNLILGSLK